MNPLPWAFSFAVVVLALALFRQARRMHEVKVGIQGIHASLNGHPTREGLGKMVYELREELRAHANAPVSQAHPTA